MNIDKEKLKSIILDEIKTPGKGIRYCAYILKDWGYEIRESKGRRTRDGNLILPNASVEKVWINVLAQYSSYPRNVFRYWYWVGIPKDIAEKILVFRTIPKLIPETTPT